MSAELKDRLYKVAEEDCKQEKARREMDLPRIKSLFLEISRVKKFDVPIWVEGTKQSDLNRDEANLNALERANLIKGQTKYTHRNVYRQYELTQKGAEVVEKLAAEP